MTKVEKNRVIQTDIINLENKITWIRTDIINLENKITWISPLQDTLLTHIGGWIHDQATLYGHTSILCAVQCDRAAANFITSVRD